MANLPTLTAIGLALALPAFAQGVPTVDTGLVVRNTAANAEREADIARQEQRVTIQSQIEEIERNSSRSSNASGRADLPRGRGHPRNGDVDGGRRRRSWCLGRCALQPGRYEPRRGPDVRRCGAEHRTAHHPSRQGHPWLFGWREAELSVVQWRCLLQALIWQESRFTIGARSPVGAFGLTQIMPGTASDLGINPAYYDSPYIQVEGGARYLSRMLAMFDGNIIYALGAYNAGPGRIIEYSGVPPFQETQHYVQVIPQKYNEYLARVGGIDALGTIDPSLMANSALSMTGAGASFYGNNSMQSVQMAAQRVRGIVQRIGTTTDIQESMALNTYARAELVRSDRGAHAPSRLADQALERRTGGARGGAARGTAIHGLHLGGLLMTIRFNIPTLLRSTAIAVILGAAALPAARAGRAHGGHPEHRAGNPAAPPDAHG